MEALGTVPGYRAKSRTSQTFRFQQGGVRHGVALNNRKSAQTYSTVDNRTKAGGGGSYGSACRQIVGAY
eukprot:6185429-Amphidinium_carterae.1